MTQPTTQLSEFILRGNMIRVVPTIIYILKHRESTKALVIRAKCRLDLGPYPGRQLLKILERNIPLLLGYRCFLAKICLPHSSYDIMIQVVRLASPVLSRR